MIRPANDHEGMKLLLDPYELQLLTDSVVEGSQEKPGGDAKYERECYSGDAANDHEPTPD